MTITDPITAPLPPYNLPDGVVSNITPFTYRDGQTYLQVLTRLRCYITDTLVPYVDTEFALLGAEFVAQVNTMIDTVNAAIATQDAEVEQDIAELTTYVDAQVQLIITSGIAVSDPVVYGIISTLASTTRVLLDTLYAPKATTYTKTQTDAADAANLVTAKAYTDTGVAGVVQRKEVPITPYQFGAVAPVAGSDNTAAISAMFAAAAGTTYTGAAIHFPPGMWFYKGATALPLFQGMKLTGAGRAKTRLINAGTANLFEWNAGYSGIHISDIWIDGSVAGKGIFAPQASGGMYGSTINNCQLSSTVDTGFIWQQNNNASFVHNTFSDTVFERTVNSTVVPISIITTAAAANFNKMDNVRFNGYNNIMTPFMHVETTLAATYLTDWVIINLLGEQNPGGILRVLGANNWTLINVTDEDSTVDYGANMIDFQDTATGAHPNTITLVSCGRRGRQMVATFYDIAFAAAASNINVINCNPSTSSQSSLIKVPTSGALIIGTRGYPSVKQGGLLPNTNINGMPGDLYVCTIGGAAVTLWVKESGVNTATGWVGK